MAMAIFVFKKCVSVEQNFVNNEDEGVSAKDEQFRQGEEFFFVSILGQVVPRLNHFRSDVHQCDCQENTTCERVCDSEYFWALATAWRPSWDHSANESFEEDPGHKANLGPEDGGWIG